MYSRYAKAAFGACAVAFVAAGLAAAQTTSQPDQPAGEQSAPAEPAAGASAAQSETQAGTEGGAQPGTEAKSAETKVKPEAGTVIATVDDTPITLADVIVMRQHLPEQYQQLPDEVLMNALVQQIVDQVMLEKAAKAEKLDEQRGVKIALRDQARAVLANAYMQQAIDKRVSDEAIEQVYKAQYADAKPVEEVHAAHILVEDEATAKDIKKQLDNGADFAALAAKYGSDSTASRGGDLGWFVHDQMVPEFADAVFAMKPGEISDPVKSPFGWHIIKMIGQREKPVPTLDQVRDQIMQDLEQKAQSDVIDEMRAKTDVEVMADKVPAAAIRSDDLIAE